MSNRDTARQVLAVLCVLLPALMTGNAVFAASDVKLTAKVEKEVVTTAADGKVVREIVPAETVIPGEEVIYTTLFNNTGDRVADKVVITSPVPENTRYKGSSAVGAETDITYSVDGGESFAPPELLTVTGRNGQQRMARPSEYTHIRWAYKPVLPPGEQGSVQFRAVLL